MFPSIPLFSKRLFYAPHLTSSETTEKGSLYSSDFQAANVGNHFDETEYVSPDECDRLIDTLGVTHLRDQHELCHLFAQLKSQLALERREVATYLPFYHFLTVESPRCSAERVYDLCDTGLRKYPRSSLQKGGGGVKQLLIDQGLSPTNSQIRDLTYRILPKIGKRFMHIAKIPFEKRWFDWEAETMDFTFRFDCLALNKMVEPKEKGVFVVLLYHWGLIDLNHGQLIFNQNGTKGLIDIYKALFLRMSVLNVVKKLIANRTAPHPLQSLKSFAKETQALHALKKELEDVNMTTLHFILMVVNGNINNQTLLKHQDMLCPKKGIYKQWLFPVDLEYEEMDQEEIEKKISIEHSRIFMETCIRIDRIKNDAFDTFVENVVWDFEQSVLKQAMCMKKELDAKKGFDSSLCIMNLFRQEIGKMASDIGGLLYDCAVYPTSEPIRLRKIVFYGKREQLGWQNNQRRSRMLEFLIAGALYTGDIEIRGFHKEPGLIQKILMEGLMHLKRAWAQFETSIDYKNLPNFFFKEEIMQLIKWESHPVTSEPFFTFLKRIRDTCKEENFNKSL